MIRVIAGEIDKAGLLYERYKRPLYAYFFKLTCGDRQASEDLVHTVFYRMIRYRTSYSGKGNFAKWLFRIAHNTGIDHNRKIKHLNNYSNEAYASQTAIYEPDDLEKNEQLAILEQAMRKLKPYERELLVLSKIDCLKYKEIADILNITESNVKIRIFRALKRLKDFYEKLEKTRYEKARAKEKTI
jgi:RNA polymerase sigma factor (sigma-70 family)